jgi:hypothetical protein
MCGDTSVVQRDRTPGRVWKAGEDGRAFSLIHRRHGRHVVVAVLVDADRAFVDRRRTTLRVLLMLMLVVVILIRRGRHYLFERGGGGERGDLGGEGGHATQQVVLVVDQAALQAREHGALRNGLWVRDDRMR